MDDAPEVVIVKSFDFDEQFAAADAESVRERVDEFLRLRFPDALSIRRAGTANDRMGADFMIEFPHGQFRFVDVKMRLDDYKTRGMNDIALEVWSNTERRKPGWALDESKLTDYFLFVWMDTGRIVMFDARALRAVTRKHLSHWQSTCKSAVQRTPTSTGGYRSSVVFVSSDELALLIGRWQGVQMAA